MSLEHYPGHPKAQRRAAEKEAEGLLKTRWKVKEDEKTDTASLAVARKTDV